jgi:RNA polymerase sporulation-specific sigma factor
MEYKDYNDEELIYLIKERSLEAKDILLNKYKYIIDALIKKYSSVIRMLGLDFKDIYQEAYLGFTDAINNYDPDKDSSIKTFISLCVQRKIQTALRNASTLKNKMLNESLSLEQSYQDEKDPLLYTIGDIKEDPLFKIIDQEGEKDLDEKIRKELSPFEYEVYSLLINALDYNEIAIILEKDAKQIDNTIQRIRNKVKKIIGLN